MNFAQRNLQIKKSQQRMVTTVLSVDGRDLADVAPGLRNEFDNFNDAFTQIMKATGKRINNLKTKRLHPASLAIRA